MSVVATVTRGDGGRGPFRALLGAQIAFALTLAPRVRAAQTGVNGSIVGSVLDQTGAPIKGVKIAASSTTQIGGKKIVYSDDEGNFRIVALLPGEFEITGTAPKLRTVVQKGVAVGIGAAAEVTLIMEVVTATEEVKVIARAPIVSTTSAVVKEVLDAEFVEPTSPGDALQHRGRHCQRDGRGCEQRRDANQRRRGAPEQCGGPGLPDRQHGVNPGGNINDPGDDRPQRLPDRQDLNAQVRFNLKPLTGQNRELNWTSSTYWRCAAPGRHPLAASG